MPKSILDIIGKVVGPLTVDSRAVAALVPSTPRRRGAVVVHDGFAALDLYQGARGPLFYLSTATALGAGFMAWKRRERGGEALALWSTVGVIAGLVAYVTRPGAGTGNAAAAQGPTALDRSYAWLDARAAVLDRQEPGWEERAMGRVLG